ncbi:hypothetical protein FGO68_gene17580 [Halteria grandinella]|uniref:Uncharacterized protein n=1 Tax=Halteria grandinella TaxID=5974 RepID=A0A8J8SYR3_HALGN|nr:hypothetical protein FGO68_gene17580 [Halteria grandinella]
METFFPDSCQRQFDEITRYFCFGCTSKEPKSVFTNSTNATIGKPATTKKYIVMCRSYIEALWGGDIEKPTKRFDNCGMTIQNVSGSYIVLPSTEFKTAAEFVNAVKPPLYGDYEIIVKSENDAPDCYGNLAVQRALLGSFSTVVIFILYLLH